MEKEIKENPQTKLLKEILEEIKKINHPTIVTKPEEKITDGWLTESEAKYSLNLTKKQISELVQENKIAFSDIAGTLFFKREDLIQYLNDCYKPSKKKK